MKLIRKAGVTSQILHVFVRDSSASDGSPKTGILFGAAGLKAYYFREGASSSSAITLVTIGTLGTYTSGGWKEVDATDMPGVYEFHPPNAVLASGATHVVILVQGATDMEPVPIEIQLIAQDLDVALNDPTVEAIADQVWDEPQGDHTIGASFGEEVQAHALSSEISDLNDPSALTIADTVWNRSLATYENENTAPQMIRDIGRMIGTTAVLHGNGGNTLLGLVQAMARSDATLPTAMGGTFDPATDSLQALREQGNAKWTGSGFEV